MSTYSKTFGLTFINDDHFYANVAIIQNFCNGICRILWGYGYDRFNFKKCFMVIAIVATLVISCLPLLPCLGKMESLLFGHNPHPVFPRLWRQAGLHHHDVPPLHDVPGYLLNSGGSRQ